MFKPHILKHHIPELPNHAKASVVNIVASISFARISIRCISFCIRNNQYEYVHYYM